MDYFIWYFILLNLKSGCVGAIVADVVMGYHKNNQTKKPIMRQANNKSDFSLEEFIAETINQYHTRNRNNIKIIKLNFDSFDAVPQSINTLMAKQNEVIC